MNCSFGWKQNVIDSCRIVHRHGASSILGLFDRRSCNEPIVFHYPTVRTVVVTLCRSRCMSVYGRAPLVICSCCYFVPSTLHVGLWAIAVSSRQILVCEAILSGEAGFDVVSIVAAESSPAVYSAVPLCAEKARLHGHGAAFYLCRLSAICQSLGLTT